jgi:hypothetical protein
VLSYRVLMIFAEENEKIFHKELKRVPGDED